MSNFAASSAADAAGPLNSYQGVPAQPAGTSQGVVWVAGAEPGGNASRAMAA